ncbi:hypothetical protein HNR75_000873 [Tolumonas osonensis]|uniref:Uncharacterized protein n=1 Tax=Tolumonas osonensis TaxID=675874 RepID=A0A841GIE3_9GAMM|nr:hypothetical protein [Tolumonas osonensis]
MPESGIMLPSEQCMSFVNRLIFSFWEWHAVVAFVIR